MFHLSEQTLAKLLSRNLSPLDRNRIQRHVEGCRACARRLEEWRDHFAEVDQELPEVPRLDGPTAAYTPGGPVLVPAERRPSSVRIDLATVLWVIAFALVGVVGYAAIRLREAPEPPIAIVPKPAYTPAPAPPEDLAPRDTLRDAGARKESTPPPRLAEEGPPPRVVAPPSRADTIAATDAGRLPTSPGFRRIGVGEALRRLGGPIRFISGLDPDHLEVAPGSEVPGAVKNADIVRVVYRLGDEGRILLDQQRIPADTSGFRPIDDPTLEAGQTALGTSPSGVSVATWLDEEGYRISLAVRAPQDSVRNLKQRVR